MRTSVKGELQSTMLQGTTHSRSKVAARLRNGRDNDDDGGGRDDGRKQTRSANLFLGMLLLRPTGTSLKLQDDEHDGEERDYNYTVRGP